MKKNNFFRNFIMAILTVFTAISCFLFLQKTNIALCQESILEPSESKIEIEVPDDGMVTVSGEIVYDSYQEGAISVSWIKNIKQSSRPSDLSIMPTTLDKPGFFSMSIPKNTGKIYIRSECVMSDEKVARGISEPIIVESNDINVGVLSLELEGVNNAIMDDYEGPTVKISGEIISDNYTQGLIHIIIKDEESYRKNFSSGDVAFKRLHSPGLYTIEVPRGIGKVHIFAVNMPTDDPKEARGDMPGTLIGDYKNPLEVEDRDIEGVDIVINEPI